ncbi:MAG: hypothetical protein ACREHF_05350 [Rhizomicrobium sp.]
MPSGLIAAPPHVLYFKSGTTYWVIDPDYLTLEAAGAPPPGGDCAPAMANVLQYFSSLGDNPRVALKLGARDYLLNSISTLNPAPANSGFSIIGKGQTVSRLVVPYAINTSGAIAITFADSYSQYLLRDFSVVAGNPGSSPDFSGGTAILMHGQGGKGGHQYGGIVERLHIGADLDSGGNGYGYFTTGLDLQYTARPLVSQTTVSGCEGNSVISNDDFSDTSPRYKMQTGIDVGECYSPMIRDSRVWNAATGVSYDSEDMTTDPQGFDVSGCNMEGVRTGVYVRHANKSCPSGIIGSGEIAFRDIGLDIGNISAWRFPNNLFFLQGTDADRSGNKAYDMSFIGSSKVTITGAGFGTFNDDAGPAGTRINISIGTLDPGTGGDTFLIDTCIFGDGNATFAISAIQITSTAGNIKIGASNFFYGTFTGPVVDDPTGVAVTQVGYPGGVVAPNGEATLGSAAVAWPSTFNQMHFLQQNPAPTFPSGWVGWSFYTDSSGTLWAWNGTIKKPLAP